MSDKPIAPSSLAAYERLPIVDPTALIMKEEVTELHGNAVALWHQYLALNPKVRPTCKTKKGYPITNYKMPKIRAAAAWLLGQFQNLKKPLPKEGIDLILALVPKRKRPLG